MFERKQEKKMEGGDERKMGGGKEDGEGRSHRMSKALLSIESYELTGLRCLCL